MTDYYKLYDYCVETFKKTDQRKKQFLANKKTRLKRELFNTIISDSSNIIKENAEEGFDYAIIYDSEYNELLYDLLDSLINHFKPFNVIYKKKTNIQRGFLEVLTDEINYVIIVDWKNKVDNSEDINKDINKDINQEDIVKKSVIYSNISELPTKNILNKESEIDNEIDNEIFEIFEIEECEKNEQNKLEEDKIINIINEFGFETIF